MSKPVDITQYTDATEMLSALGRFDYMAMLLTIVSFILVLGGLFAFLNIRSSAKKVAAKEAKEVSKIHAETTVNLYLQENLHSIVETYMDLNGFGVTDIQADDIADAQEEGS